MNIFHRVSLALLVGMVLVPLHGLGQTTQAQPKHGAAPPARRHKKAKSGEGQTAASAPAAGAPVATTAPVIYGVWGRRAI